MAVLGKADRDFQTKAAFLQYMLAHPEERFWQAVRNFSGHPFVLVSKEPPFNFPGDSDEWVAIGGLPQDTFNWEVPRED